MSLLWQNYTYFFNTIHTCRILSLTSRPISIKIFSHDSSSYVSLVARFLAHWAGAHILLVDWEGSSMLSVNRELRFNQGIRKQKSVLWVSPFIMLKGAIFRFDLDDILSTSRCKCLQNSVSPIFSQIKSSLQGFPAWTTEN